MLQWSSHGGLRFIAIFGPCIRPSETSLAHSPAWTRHPHLGNGGKQSGEPGPLQAAGSRWYGAGSP